MKSLIILLAIISCIPQPEVPVVVPPPVVNEDTIESLLAKDPAQYPKVGWVADYDKIILLTLKKYPVKNLPCDPLVTLAGIVKAESAFNKNSTYMEPAPLNYSSDGLLQLSIQDESWAHCGLKSKKDLYNPILNLYCGIKILNLLENKNPNENFWEYGGRYWSTLRDNKWPKWKGKNQGGWNTVRQYWKNQGCSVN